MSTEPRRLQSRRSRESESPWAFIAPNWFTTVMGTGILPLALLGLPVRVPGDRLLATGLWVLAAVLLVAVTAATVLHHLTHPQAARSHRRDEIRIQFYGAPAMAAMTVGAGALSAGRPLLGDGAVLVAGVLWSTGTALGLATAVLVPLRMVRDFQPGVDRAFAGWLVPVVPPLVSAASGALLLDELPAGGPRQALALFCLAGIGLSGGAAALVIVILVIRLITSGVGPVHLVPTWWIALGPLGQFVTAAHHLAVRAPAGHEQAALELTVACGIPVLGFAGLWAGGALLVTWQAWRDSLPFTLAWWSFTFPVGTVVTGLSGMAQLTGSAALTLAAMASFGALVTAWLVVFVRTLRGVIDRSLLASPPGVTRVEQGEPNHVPEPAREFVQLIADGNH